MIHSTLSFISFKEYGLHLIDGIVPPGLKYMTCGREKPPRNVIIDVRDMKNIIKLFFHC